MTYGLRAFCFLRPSCFLAFLLLSCCATQIEPELKKPPLYSSFEARVGISIPGEVRAHTYSDPLRYVDIGAISSSRFEQAFVAMFSDPVELPDWPPWQENIDRLDGVIELSSMRFEYTPGHDDKIFGKLATPDRAFVSYNVCLYRTDGTAVKCWDVSESQIHQRGMSDCLFDTKCASSLIDVTVRGAIARFMFDFERDPLTSQWAQDIKDNLARQ